MPKIGMGSSAMVMADWLDALKAAADIGYDAFEISCVFPSADPENILPASIDAAREILAENQMGLCVHAPFFEINIAALCDVYGAIEEAEEDNNILSRRLRIKDIR